MPIDLPAILHIYIYMAAADHVQLNLRTSCSKSSRNCGLSLNFFDISIITACIYNSIASASSGSLTHAYTNNAHTHTQCVTPMVYTSILGNSWLYMFASISIFRGSELNSPTKVARNSATRLKLVSDTTCKLYAVQVAKLIVRTTSA